jgi:DNA replication protein DnaC
MIAKNVAFQAVQAGYSVIFTTAAELIERLQGDLSPTTFRRKLGHYANCELLCIDEVGYLAYDAHAPDLLYKVVDRRYEKHSVLLTTNLLCGAPHKRFNAERIVMRSLACRGPARTSLRWHGAPHYGGWCQRGNQLVSGLEAA